MLLHKQYDSHPGGTHENSICLLIHMYYIAQANASVQREFKATSPLQKCIILLKVLATYILVGLHISLGLLQQGGGARTIPGAPIGRVDDALQQEKKPENMQLLMLRLVVNHVHATLCQ